MELCESEYIRLIDQHRIGIHEVHTIFDDGRREQDIVFPIPEIHDLLFDIISAHLPMYNRDADDPSQHFLKRYPH